MNDNLDSNRNDYIASIFKGIIPPFPFGNAILEEIFNYLIPNQRTDRIAHFIRELKKRCDTFENILKEHTEKIILLEQGIRLSAKTNISEKREWLSCVVAKGITENVSIDLADRILQIIDTINTEQFIILYYYYKFENQSVVEKNAFENKYPDILNPSHLWIKNQELAKLNIGKNKYNINTLVNMGLLDRPVKLDRPSDLGFPDKYSARVMDGFYKEIKSLYKDLLNSNEKVEYEITVFGHKTIESILDTEIESHFLI